MFRLTGIILVIGCFTGNVLAISPSSVADIPRVIVKEPEYQSKETRYGLIVVGREMKKRIWVALDKSMAERKEYDIAFADLNSNGNLDEPDERFVARHANGESTFELPDITDSDGQTHTKFTLRVNPQLTVMVGMNWSGKRRYGGGYPADPNSETYTKFAVTVTDAPVLWLNGDGPFTFQQWLPESLEIGGATEVRLFIGTSGVGTGSFCAFQEHALPMGEGILGVLHYKKVNGEDAQHSFALMDKC